MRKVMRKAIMSSVRCYCHEVAKIASVQKQFKYGYANRRSFELREDPFSLMWTL